MYNAASAPFGIARSAAARLRFSSPAAAAAAAAAAHRSRPVSFAGSCSHFPRLAPPPPRHASDWRSPISLRAHSRASAAASVLTFDRKIATMGSIHKDSPAAKYLLERGVDRRDFNSYGSRRGNDEVGPKAVHIPTGEKLNVSDATMVEHGGKEEEVKRSTKICIVIRSFDNPLLENYHFGTRNTLGLPESRVLHTVLRSPHIDKKSREQFEMKIKKRLVVIEAKPHELRKKFFWLKRQRIFGAQYEIRFSYKTRLDMGKLQRLL